MTQLALFATACVSLTFGLTALRVGRRTGFGLVSLSVLLAVWMAGLILLDRGSSWAERVMPLGMLLAGAFASAASDAIGKPPRFVLPIAWGGAAVVALIGFVAPGLLYGPGARGAGPLFWVIAGLSVVGTLAVKRWLFTLVRAARGRERTRRLSILFANVAGALGGGGLIGLHVLGFDVAVFAAPLLAVSVITVALATWVSEAPQGRAALLQGLVQSLVVAVLATILVLFVVPELALAAGFVSLPIDAARQLLVDTLTQRLFARPLTTTSLAVEAESLAVKAEHSERLAEVGRLASGVAHEIRNPLGVILAEMKVLELSGADKESVDAVKAQVARAKSFVDDLLNYATPRPLTPVDTSLNELVVNAVTRAARGLGIESPRVDVDVRDRAEVDVNAMSDVLVNLIANALIATEENGRVRITGDARGITVIDDGPGVPRELEARLFQAFTTGRSRDAKRPGTGLGLALSRRLVERHGGTLTFTRPSTFTISFGERP
ncbi:MAG: sensor histidine kinase [Archangium sp.]